jgi:hypothetical protein
MKTAARVISVLMILTGVVWTLQGANVLPGSFMTGSPFWLAMGIVVGLAGIGLWVLAGRFGKQTPDA